MPGAPGRAGCWAALWDEGRSRRPHLSVLRGSTPLVGLSCREPQTLVFRPRMRERRCCCWCPSRPFKCASSPQSLRLQRCRPAGKGSYFSRVVQPGEGGCGRGSGPADPGDVFSLTTREDLTRPVYFGHLIKKKGNQGCLAGAVG